MRAVNAVVVAVTLIAFMRAAPSGYDLTLVVEDVRNTRGVIGVLVFKSPEGWTLMAVPAKAPVTMFYDPRPAAR